MAQQLMNTTRKRNDNHGTEFGTWIRNRERVSSKLGYIATDLDYVWENYKTKQIMLIEEKRYMSKLTFAQTQTFRKLDDIMKLSPHYCGFHLLQFEHKDPTDGRIFWNGDCINSDDLLDKLQFNNVNKGGYFATQTLSALIS
jgi:hypothetical protein